MTSFGFSVFSDIVSLTTLAYKLSAHVFHSRDDYKSMSVKVESLRTTLRAVNEQLELSSSGSSLDENSHREQIVSKCNTRLEEIGDSLKRHEHIDSQSVIHSKVRLKDLLGSIESLREMGYLVVRFSIQGSRMYWGMILSFYRG